MAEAQEQDKHEEFHQRYRGLSQAEKLDILTRRKLDAQREGRQC